MKIKISDLGFRISDFIKLTLLIVCCSLFPVPSQNAFAQMSSEELRREQIETIEALRSTENISGGSSKLLGSFGRKTGWLFSYGAAFGTTYTGGDNGSDRNGGAADAQDHSYEYEMKPFLTVAAADRQSKFYTRLNMKYTETKKNSASIRGSNFIQPTVDMAYWEKNFSSKGTAKGASEIKHKFVVGRQFVQVGRGIAFAQTADGFFYEAKGFAKNKGEYKAFALRQNPSDDQVDLSAIGAGRSKRFYYGIRGKYTVHPKAKMSLYGVHVKDNNTELSMTSAIQKHKFEPEYYGVVSEGRITKDLQYWGEYIMERGKTFDSAVASSTKVNIRAAALVAGLKYYFEGDLKPTIYGEYISGSGDPEATSSNSTLGGSYPGTNDSRFNPFGGVSMGFALSPTMTNMKVYKAGATIKPFARSVSRYLQDMVLQPEYYMYQRRTGGSGAAGNDSVLNSANSTDDIGDEFDFTVSWRLFSDVTYQLKYGHFSPGNAYPTTSSETYWRFKVSIDM